MPEARVHAVAYDDPERAVHAVRALRAAGFTVRDVHTPFPVHGMAEAMGLAETRLGYATLIGAALGAGTAFGFQVWSHAVDWPLVIGGKDPVAWPALVPVTFELAVLLAAFATVAALLVKGRLWPRAGAASQPAPEVSDDRFVVLVDEQDAGFAPARFQAIVESSGSDSVVELRRAS